MKDWDYEVSDYLHLMIQFLEHRISVDDYRRRFFELSSRRIILSDDEDIIIQKAFGDADDYEGVVHLPYTIGEPELRERVAESVKALERFLGIDESI